MTADPPTHGVPHDFRILSKVGEGGSAIVYRAIHVPSEWHVALKVWKTTDGYLTPEQRRKFLDECRLQREMSERSPRVVRYYWSGAPEGAPPWLAMELHETSLAARMSVGPLQVEEWSGMADEILQGLAVIHQSGHVHRDIKPANILLTNGHAFISDLGITMPTDGWTADLAAGTTAFLPPEAGTQAPNPRGDVYSLAKTLLAAAPDDLPDRVEQLLTRAASHEPADRPADANEFRRMFRSALAQQGLVLPTAQAESTGPRQDGPDPITPPNRHRSWVAASMLTALIAFGGSAYVFEVRDSGERPSGQTVVNSSSPSSSPATSPTVTATSCRTFDGQLPILYEPAARDLNLTVEGATADGYTTDGHISLGMALRLIGTPPPGQLWVVAQAQAGVLGEGGLKDPGFLYPKWKVAPDSAGCLVLEDVTLYEDDRLIGVPWTLHLIHVPLEETDSLHQARQSDIGGWQDWGSAPRGIERILHGRIETTGFQRF